jgi:hypothetical protein
MSHEVEFQTISIETDTKESSDDATTTQLDESSPPWKEEKPVKLKADGTPDKRANNKFVANVWKPGQSGNPAGRPKGSRGKLTLLREAVLHNSETLVLKDFEDIVKATLELAKAGDSTCLKIIWDRIIPSKRAINEVEDGKEDKLNISISIQGMEVGSIGGEAVDGEFTEVEEKPIDDKSTDK